VLYCNSAGGPSDKLGFLSGNPTPGSIFTATAELANRLIPASVTIEPDADHDGYGDETQDQCPQNPAAHFQCSVVAPVPALSVSALARAQKGSAQVLVASSVQASVTVTATVKLGKGKKATLRGGTKSVAPGAIAPFTLRFPAKLKSRLAKLSPKQFLKLKVQTSARDALGQTRTRLTPLKLPGQG
jgi:hypothetical protein